MTKPNSMPKHYIQELLDERNWDGVKLAKKAGLSTGYISRLLNYERPVTTKLADKIGKALGVDPHKVVEIPFEKRLLIDGDEALLGSALGWILAAAEKKKLELSHKEASQWATYVYRCALEQSFNSSQTKFFAESVIDILHKKK